MPPCMVTCMAIIIFTCNNKEILRLTEDGVVLNMGKMVLPPFATANRLNRTQLPYKCIIRTDNMDKILSEKEILIAITLE